MKVTRYESPKCPLCGSYRVTLFDKGSMIGCSDCGKSTGYTKALPVEKGDKPNAQDESGEINLTLMFICCAIFLSAAVYLINQAFLPVKVQSVEEVKVEAVTVGECYTYSDDDIVARSCTDGAPEWENKDNYKTVVMIAELGVNKVKAIYFKLTCDDEYIENSAFTLVDKLSYYQGEDSIFSKIDCPDGVTFNLEE